MAKITFRLKGDNTPLTWSVPQEGVMSIKEGKGRKYINYYPGQDSIFTEDITAANKDIKFASVPDFTYNYLTKHTELSFDDSDVALYNYLVAHPWHERKWQVYSKDIEAKGKLEKYDKMDQALEYIKESDEIKVKAMSLVVFGLHMQLKSTVECKAQLKEKALSNPHEIISAFEADNYETKYAASLAFCTGIVKNNATSTAVVWNDGTEGVIVHVAQGENGIDKLTDLLSKDTDVALTTMQEFENRFEQVENGKFAKINAHTVLKEKDEEIAALKKQLEAAKSGVTLPPKQIDPNLTLEEAQEQYKSKTGNDVPVRYKNDLAWISEKLAQE